MSSRTAKHKIRRHRSSNNEVAVSMFQCHISRSDFCQAYPASQALASHAKIESTSELVITKETLFYCSKSNHFAEKDE